jgi:hypothetical protein
MVKQAYPGANDIVTGGIDPDTGVPVMVADAKDKDGLYIRGTYEVPAIATYKGRTYACFSEYWRGTIPDDMIGVALELKKVVD